MRRPAWPASPPSTVSRVVRGSTPVSEELESAVREAIRVTGYVPNLAARQLVTSRSDAVGVVIPEISWRRPTYPFFANMVEGVATRLASTRYRFILVMGRSAEDPEWLLDYVGGGRRHRRGHADRHPSGAACLGDADDVRSACRAATWASRSSALRTPGTFDADNVFGGVRQAVGVPVRRGARRIADALACSHTGRASTGAGRPSVRNG